MGVRKENIIFKLTLYERVEGLLGIDLRSLGFFRVGIGLIIVIDLIVRALSLRAHYTDAGVVPRTLVLEYGEQPWLLSFHMLSGDVAPQVILFLLTGLCALALMLGYKSRAACFSCWVLMLSLHVRNPFVNNLGDWLLVNLLFWGMFLPLGAKFSIDRMRGPSGQILPRQVLSVATLAILLQICIVYFFSVRHKISPVWQVDGTALQYALNLDRITSPWGHALLDLPENVLKFLTFTTLTIEKWGPVLVFWPFFIGFQRSFIALVFIGFHISLALFFELGLFPFICITAWILFLPGSFWEKIRSWIYARRSKLKKYKPDLKDSHYQSSRGNEKLPLMEINIFQSVIVICGLFCIVCSALLYGGLMDNWYYERVYKHVEPVVNSLNMKQRWDMFSPQPPKNDGWFVVVAYTKEGGVVDLLRPEEALTWSRPADIAATYKNQRWRKYLEWVMNKEEPFVTHLARYGEKKYLTMEHKGKELVGVRVYFMQESTLTDLTTSNVIRRQLY